MSIVESGRRAADDWPPETRCRRRTRGPASLLRHGAATALICVLACLAFASRPVDAHPVAQGALDVVVFADHVSVRATVAEEEVLVAASYGDNPLPLTEAVRRHGEYLLAHLRVTADGHLLEGRVAGLPDNVRGRPSYELDYRLTDSAPGHIVLTQDVLREFDFAPGNPWEATYLVRIGLYGQTAAEGRLLTFRQPIDFECEWTPLTGTTGAAVPNRGLAASFVGLGIMHILTGYDHLLFVAALLLAVVSLWDLIKVISVFTLAHTLTLVLAALDVFRLPESIVEPMIAASIVFVATQNIFWPQKSLGASRLVVAFLFGLFHGLGFAGGLLDAMASLNGATAVVAIAAFSAGVELGHQVVVVPAYGALRLYRHLGGAASRSHGFVRQYGSAIISLLGIVYLVAALR